MSAPSAPSTSRLDGKVALVTGSGRGMGRQNALELASRGASVVINYSRASAPAAAVVQEVEALGSQAIAIAADVSKPAEIATLFEKAVAHFGKLDIVVSNSGVESFGHISEVTADEFDRVFAVNTRGQLLVAQQAYKHLGEGGRLVMLSSISASAKGVADHNFGRKGITVNAIAPGGIKTDMYVEAARKYIPNEASMTDKEIDELAASWSPLNRVGLPEDVSRVVAFLCSQDGEWMNGQVLTIGGGASL
ncbi:MAG: hypothetical protein Q9161_000160 [Pseudevernia consocians]